MLALACDSESNPEATAGDARAGSPGSGAMASVTGRLPGEYRSAERDRCPIACEQVGLPVLHAGHGRVIQPRVLAEGTPP